MSPLFTSAGPALQGLMLAATTTKSKTSSYSTFIFLGFILLIGYFLLIRPQRQRARRQQQQQQDIGVGDEVMLTSGIIGTIMGFDGDRAQVEIADGVEIEVVRRAIAQRVTQPEPVEPSSEEEDEHHEVGPDPASLEQGDYDHASDQPWEGAHDEEEGDEADGASQQHEDGVTADGTERTGSGGISSGATENPAAAKVPRVPGGGLGDPTQPDGPAGKE